MLTLHPKRHAALMQVNRKKLSIVDFHSDIDYQTGGNIMNTLTKNLIRSMENLGRIQHLLGTL